MDYIKELSEQCAKHVEEIFPWDYQEQYGDEPEVLFIDVREPYEYAAGHVKNAINVPRGILETAASFGYEDTIPRLASAQNKVVVVACRSGKRSLWAARTLQLLGFKQVYSLKTGMRGWNDYELPLYDNEQKQIAIERLDEFFTPLISAEQLGKGWVVKNWRS